MKKELVVLSSIAALAIAGCAPKIPECGDPAVEKMLRDISNQGYTKMAEAARQEVIQILGSMYLKSVNVKPAVDSKIASVSTTKKDGRVGTCEANLEAKGTLNFEVTLIDDERAALMVKTNFQLWAAQAPERVKRIVNDPSWRESKAQLMWNEPLSETHPVTYTVNYTDKGDQVVVKVVGTK